jgi:hypothetical protein
MQSNNAVFDKIIFDKKTSFAEIFESSIYQVSGICWDKYKTPKLGQLIQIKYSPTSEAETLIGCVTETLTESIDPMKTPIAYQMTEEELQAEQPQIFEFLVSKFKAKIIGLCKEREILFSVPERPPNIHSFINYLDQDFATNIVSDPEFFHTLLSGDTLSNLNNDELLLSIFRQISQSKPVSQNLIESFYNLYRTLLKNDAYKVRYFFKRLSKIIRIEGI